MSKYLSFKVSEQKAKTKVYNVYNKERDIILGVIKWYPQWRQYVFFPKEDTLFSQGCMTDISNFIKKEMELRKKHK